MNRKGELLASVYSVNRGPMVWLMAAVFVAIVVAVGGRKEFINIKLGIYNALYLFYFSSDDLQRNIPDTGGCISGRIYNSCDDVYGLMELRRKSVAAMLGTIIGVVFSGAFALIFGQVTSITGYNVSDIENLVYVGENDRHKKLVNCYLQES